MGERLLSVHLPALWNAPFVEVARRHPAPVIMVHQQGHVRPADHDHLAALLRLMELENVRLKMSGFPYLAERTWDHPFPAEHDTLRRVVGADRLLWGSDFPVSAADLSYRQTIEVVREHCDFLTETELDAVMGGTLALLGRVAQFLAGCATTTQRLAALAKTRRCPHRLRSPYLASHTVDRRSPSTSYCQTRPDRPGGRVVLTSACCPCAG